MDGYRPRHLARAPRATRRMAALTGLAIAAVVASSVVAVASRTDAEPEVEVAGSSTSRDERSSTSSTTSTAPPLRTGSVAFSGDVLIHTQVWEAADTGAGHDFTPMLAPVVPQLAAADVAVCHLEVTLARPEDPLSSFPRFRAPGALAANLAAAGFDGCSVASNHALDFGEQGVVATLAALDEAGLRHAGTARSAAEDAMPAVYDVDGIAVAQLSYSYGFNGFVEPADKPWLVDQIDPAVVLADAAAARAAGAELVFVSMHWGNEYAHGVTEAQQAVASALAAVPGAVDLVVGHHAHVVQPISKVGDMWVVWGMGNMLSSNSPDCCTTVASDGVVVTVTIGDTAPGGPVAVTGMAFTPTWNERSTYRVLPVERTLANGSAVDLTDALQASLERTTEHILSLGGAALGVERVAG